MVFFSVVSLFQRGPELILKDYQQAGSNVYLRIRNCYANKTFEDGRTQLIHDINHRSVIVLERREAITLRENEPFHPPHRLVQHRQQNSLQGSDKGFLKEK